MRIETKEERKKGRKEDMIATEKTQSDIKSEKLRIAGMDCADCALSIERSLSTMPGVSSASVNFAVGAAQVSYNPAVVGHEALARRIKELGYSVEETAQPLAQPASLEFRIEGMDCADCALTVEKLVAAMPGVAQASLNFGSARLLVVPAEGVDRPSADSIERVVTSAGYRAIPAHTRQTANQVPFWRRDRRIVTTATGAVLALLAFALSFTATPVWAVNALFGASVVACGLNFARAGLLALRAGRADMNLLMSVAAVGAMALGDWGEAATVVLLFAIGGTLQVYTLDKTRNAIRALMNLSPATALVRRPDPGRGPSAAVEVRVPVEEVQPGETVLVGPGERVAVDGTVTAGASSVDQASITGESVPVDVEPGSGVFAGTINGPGALTITSTRAASDTTLSRIISMVEEAQSRRAPSQTFVDRFTAVYTPVVIVVAVLLAALPPLLLAQPFGEWFYRALVLLVVACPCALVISTPVSIVAAIGAATQHGVLVKGGATLEALGKVRALAFDKTGTLTQGRPQVVAVHALDGSSKDDLMRLVATVEARSEHPLAKAMVNAAPAFNGNRVEATDFTALPGLGARAVVDEREVYVGNPRLFEEQGIATSAAASLLDQEQGSGNTAVLVGTKSGVLGVVALADRPRSEAAEALRTLRSSGIAHMAMLTGDNPQTAAAISQMVGVDEYYASLLPADKLDAIQRMLASHGPVAMVGDGVNDAPALAASTVGIAMGVAGTDAALEVADVALMSDDLSRLNYAIGLSRRTLGTIKINVAVSLITKAFALVLAVVGVLPLWGAILADMGVSLIVTLNGLRLLAYRGR